MDCLKMFLDRNLRFAVLSYDSITDFQYIHLIEATAKCKCKCKMITVYNDL